ncbi:MAG: rhodanese-like domain-containing protein [Firmicutes bacterium]|nr:rhodanese-like domain-containing protein [Bacillota bacterium]
MGIFDFLKGSKIDDELNIYRQTEGAVLLDVRTREEYRQGRISGSKNIPLQEISSVEQELPDKEIPLFVHCQSGVRSGQAVSLLKQMGYKNVKNIGGLNGYKGVLEK